MRSTERRSQLDELLKLHGELDYSWISGRFGVSEMTARRDLEALEAEGKARRVRGGAISLLSRAYEPPLSERLGQDPAGKQAIAIAACQLVHTDDTLFIDAGTTATEFARHLAKADLDVLVITSNLHAAAALAECEKTKVLVSGGLLRRTEQSLVGAETIQMLERYNVDTAFVGAAGIHQERGLTDYGVEESAVKRSVLNRANRVIALADASKIGRISLCEVCGPEDIDVLISDCESNNSAICRLQEIGTEFIQAQPSTILYN